MTREDWRMPEEDEKREAFATPDNVARARRAVRLSFYGVTVGPPKKDSHEGD